MDDSNLSRDQYRRAQELATRGAYSEAVAAYTLAIDADSDNMRARIGRGLAYQRAGAHSLAISDFSDVLSQAPESLLAFIAYYSRACSLRAIRRYEEALYDCDCAIALNPLGADVIYLRGLLLEDEGNVDEAVCEMDRLIDVAPSDTRAYIVRGRLFLRQGKWRLAVIDASLAIEKYSEEDESLRGLYFLRGIAKQELCEHDSAIEDLTEAIRLRADEPNAYLRRSRSYEALGDITSSKADVECWRNLVNSFENAGDSCARDLNRADE